MIVKRINYFDNFENSDIALCLGFFDAIHLGHQELIKEAKKSGKKVALLSLDHSPAYVLSKIEKDIFLNSSIDKEEILSYLGVDYFYILHFDKDVMRLTKDEFISSVIDKLHPSLIVCGEDYSFGYKGEGTPKDLKEKYQVSIIPLLKQNGVKISSSQIKEDIKNRDIKSANESLGRLYKIEGKVVDGKKNGRKIGFPTANIDTDLDYVIPGDGVYMGYVVVDEVSYKSIIAVGKHPTLGSLEKEIIEAHILDFDKDIYGKTISIQFVDLIRDNRLFDSIDDLINQLKFDSELARKSLK